jgi:O-succinylbenzoate synthase
MTITAVDIFTYRLPLKRPLRLKTQTIAERRGCLIRLQSKPDLVGWGEAAPLPGFSRESLTDAREQLLYLKSRLVGSDIPEDAAQLSGQFDAWLDAYDLSPSARFGVETATLNLVAATRSISLSRLLSERPLETIQVNGLITDDPPALECARRLSRDGYRAVKMKLGHDTIEQDVTRTRDVYHELSGSAALRLDANRSWSFDDAVKFAEAIVDCQPEYIEEPLADPSRLQEFHARTGLRIALDETLLEILPENLTEFGFVTAVVLKPTLLGSAECTASLARAARQMRTKTVISSCFESSVGIATLAQMAAVYNSLDSPAGLDTLDWLEHDLLMEPIDCAHGRIRIGQVSRVARKVDESFLTEVTND